MAATVRIAGSLPAPRQATLRALRERDGDLLDRALVLVFPGPASATGEDVVEFHCHGGRAVVEAVQRELLTIPGVREAEPGEFTRRALANGRIDLTEAEGLADLLEAETEVQRRLALAAAEGRVSRAVRGWFDRLTDLSARVEASIDFAEEGDVGAEADVLAGVVADQQALVDEMEAVLAAPPVERWRDGIRVVVAGPPNAGKSTLVNALASREAAIVSPVAGTTRDRIEVPVRRNGIAYVLVDTAGLRDDTDDTDDAVERVGIQRAREAMAVGDIVLWLGDTDLPAGALFIHARVDLPNRLTVPRGAIPVSAYDAASVEAVWAGVEDRVAIPRSDIQFTNRVAGACRRCVTALGCRSVDSLVHAEQLRAGRNALASALGIDATDAMLDALFSRFCLGK